MGRWEAAPARWAVVLGRGGTREKGCERPARTRGATSARSGRCGGRGGRRLHDGVSVGSAGDGVSGGGHTAAAGVDGGAGALSAEAGGGRSAERRGRDDLGP